MTQQTMPATDRLARLGFTWLFNVQRNYPCQHPLVPASFSRLRRFRCCLAARPATAVRVAAAARMAAAAARVAAAEHRVAVADRPREPAAPAAAERRRRAAPAARAMPAWMRQRRAS